jgi:hypothetical protein
VNVCGNADAILLQIPAFGNACVNDCRWLPGVLSGNVVQGLVDVPATSPARPPT